MKIFYKSTGLFYLMMLLNQSLTCQIISENFNSGLPANWAQTPPLSWTLSSNFGTSGSSCAFSQELTTATVTASLHCPTLNLIAVTNVTVTFQAAVVGNNFIVPNVALSIDTGIGAQTIARWGSGFSPNTTYTISGGYDYMPPLDVQYVHWFSCTQTLSAMSSTMTSFIFDAEFINGGYILIDDILINGKPVITAGVEKNFKDDIIGVFPNPVTGKRLTIKSPVIKNTTIADNLGRCWPLECQVIGNETEVDLVKIPNGVYILSAITGDDILIRRKIVIE